MDIPEFGNLIERREIQIRKDAERCEIEQRIYDLRQRLASENSDIGDWKIIKCYEARMKNAEDPYDVDALMEARQEVRDEINTLQEKL